jgi:hypothetical protein
MLLSPTVRAALAFACLSAWLVLLFSGVIFGKAVYLLLVAALVLFPWRWLRVPSPLAEDDRAVGDTIGNTIGNAAELPDEPKPAP